MENVEKEIGEIQQCVKGLIEEVSKKVVQDMSLSLLVPDELAALDYVKKNFEGLQTGEVPPSYELEQFCKPEEEEEGICAGTILLVVFLGLGIMISMKKKGGRHES